jgi:gliding motility-associated lipoprotein GldH
MKPCKQLSQLLPLLVLLFLFSCADKSIVYSNVQNVSPQEWMPEEKVGFLVTITDTTVKYDFSIYLRHNIDYGWSNLFLFMKTVYPNHTYSLDTLECTLAEPTGKWLGRGFGTKKELTVLVKTVKFSQKGNYFFEMEQGMRDLKLKNMENIGIIISKYQDND